MSEATYVSAVEQISQQLEKNIKSRRSGPRVYVLNSQDIFAAKLKGQFILITIPCTEKKLVSLSSADKYWKNDGPDTQDPFVFLPRCCVCGKLSDIRRYFDPLPNGVVPLEDSIRQAFFEVIWHKQMLNDPNVKAQFDQMIAETAQRRQAEREEAKVRRAQAPLSLVTARALIDPTSVDPSVILPSRYNAANEDVAPYFVTLVRHKDEKTGVARFGRVSQEAKERKKRSGRGKSKSLEQLIVEVKPGHARDISNLAVDGSRSTSMKFDPTAVRRAGSGATYQITLNFPGVGDRILIARGTPEHAHRVFSYAADVLDEPHKTTIQNALKTLYNGAFNSVVQNMASGMFQTRL